MVLPSGKACMGPMGCVSGCIKPHAVPWLVKGEAQCCMFDLTR